MIRHISIKNFATIEKAEIDFHSGLNTITGETGAGKSVAVEAMSLALGSRADTAYVRSGNDKAVIQMIAEDKDDEYIITREISASGKNICRINDEIVTLGHLNALCKKLADIHGQYDHQSLLNPDHHIHLVDLYQKDQILPVKEKVQHLYQSYTSLRSRLKSILEETAKNKREQDFMAYELEELQNAQLQIGEDVELEEKIELLQNSERIYENLAGAYQIASDDENAALSAIKRRRTGREAFQYRKCRCIKNATGASACCAETGTSGCLRDALHCTKRGSGTAGTKDNERTDSAELQRCPFLHKLQTRGALDIRRV